ncbi:MAG: peptidylprolyl isomerase [Burkholderiales bacterium]
MNLDGLELNDIRQALLDAARQAGFTTADADGEDAAIEAFLESSVQADEPSEAECERFYRSHPDRFVAGDLATVSHILFAVPPGAPLDAIRHQAESTLTKLLADGDAFESVARDFSNCPTGANGGWLGTLGRGESYPEFESAVLPGDALGLLTYLVRTRAGFHIVKVHDRRPGRTLGFDEVREDIALHLGGRAQVNALLKTVQKVVANGDERRPAEDPASGPRAGADVHVHRFAKRGP